MSRDLSSFVPVLALIAWLPLSLAAALPAEASSFVTVFGIVLVREADPVPPDPPGWNRYRLLGVSDPDASADPLAAARLDCTGAVLSEERNLALIRLTCRLQAGPDTEAELHLDTPTDAHDPELLHAEFGARSGKLADRTATLHGVLEVEPFDDHGDTAGRLSLATSWASAQGAVPLP